MKQLLFLFIIFYVSLFNVSAQDNSSGLFPSRNSTEWELLTYGRKKQLLSKTINYFKFIDSTDGYFNGNVYSTLYDADGKKLTQYHYSVISTKGDLTINMISVMADDQHIFYAKFDMAVYQDEPLFIPANPVVNQTLPNGKFASNMLNKKTRDVQESLALDATDRKVLAKESVTVPAGVFECYKISTTIHSHAIVLGVSFKYTFKIFEWYAPGVGVVKSEVYDKKGEFACYSVLTKHSILTSK